MAGTNFFKINAKEIPERVFCFVHFNEILSAHKEDRLLGIFMLFLIQILVNF
jgi:hypothetical protein